MIKYREHNLTKKRYAACIAIDLINSEKMLNQNENLTLLKRLINQLNEQYSGKVVVPFQIRGGDEVIGVVNSFAGGYHVAHDVWLFSLEKKMKVRIGIGFGKYDTLDTIDPNLINGSCVISAFRARDKFLKLTKDNPYALTGPIQIYAYANELQIPFQAVNALMYTMYELIKTEKQQKLVFILQQYPDENYEQIAERLGYLKDSTSQNNRSTISKMLKRMKYKTFTQIKIDIAHLLSSYQNLLDEEWKHNDE
ncbi:SatD family protein [Metabacillus malikii]|uniref:SatD family (SatD) n=1 Tax=Metabacillus malikii TaxID=1504265 RepID=A0ABT9ZEM5_9BACI|nr:SatD family protein [Metabacillus malikii]MDQ0230684.1 hypothetical protein [Metabacillus malikii]